MGTVAVVPQPFNPAVLGSLTEPNVQPSMRQCWYCQRVYACGRSYANVAAYELEHGVVLDQTKLVTDPTKSCMHAWSFHRKPGDHYKAPKVKQSDVARAFTSYKADELSLDDLEAVLRSYLVQFVPEDDADDFITEGEPTNVGTKSGKVFASALKQRALEWLEHAGRDLQQEQEPQGETYEGRKRESNRAALTAAHTKWLDASEQGKADAFAELFEVTRRYAERKIRFRIYGVPEGRDTSDDLTQDCLLDIIEQLPFITNYATYVSHAVFNAGRGGVKKALKHAEKWRAASLTIIGEDGSVEDNPILHQRADVEHDNHRLLFGNRALPDTLTGRERSLVAMLQQGYEYAEIAEMFAMSIGALKVLASRLKGKHNGTV